jgi:hypothetical protein
MKTQVAVVSDKHSRIIVQSPTDVELKFSYVNCDNKLVYRLDYCTWGTTFFDTAYWNRLPFSEIIVTPYPRYLKQHRLDSIAGFVYQETVSMILVESQAREDTVSIIIIKNI